MNPAVWPEGYTAAEVERFDEAVLNGLIERNLTRGTGFMELRQGHTPELQAHLDAQQAPRKELATFGLRLEVRHQGEVVAWSYSRAQSPRTLVMMTSGVEQAHRRQGLYTAMLRHISGRARELGFEELRSSHSVANRPILIAKLTEGWGITGTELDLSIGLLVKLQLQLCPVREAAYDYRSGWRPPTAELLALYPKE